MDDSLQMVQTKGSQLKKDHRIEVVVFNSRAKSIRKPRVENKYKSTHENSEFNIKDATKEVIKLGAKGFYQRRRDRTLKSFAVELGAKPEKKRCHNYKELKEIRKTQREIREKRLNFLKESRNLVSNSYKHSKNQKSKRKSDISILKNYGKKK